MKSIIIIMSLLISGFAYSSSSNFTTERIKGSFVYGGSFYDDESFYLIGVPESKPNEKLPVVIAIHGDEGHPNNMVKFWEKVWEEKKNFIFVAPQCPKQFCKKGSTITWSAGGPENSDKQAKWLLQVIADVVRKYPADRSKVYAVGYSGGAIFLGYQGFKLFQEKLAGIQWFCGGVNEREEEVYQSPKNLECKVPGRLVISKTGDRSYLVTAAERIEEILQNNGHQNEFLDTGCKGHCCNASKLSENALDWFLKLPPLCGGNP